MRRFRLKLTLAASFVAATVCHCCAAAEPAALIRIGDTWKFTAASSLNPAAFTNWFQPDFDDAAWTAAPSGFSYGYGAVSTATTLAAFPTNGMSHLFRRRFEIQNPADIAALILRADYEDGLILYLNGFEIARRNLPGTPGTPLAPSTGAITTRFRGAADELDLGAFVDRLRPGENVLAAAVHNSSAFDFGMAFVPELLANFNRGPFVQNVSTSSAVVVFRTPQPWPAWVEWGPTEALGMRAESAVVSTNHAVRLDGLNPATRYFYRVGVRSPRGEGRSTRASFRTFAESGPVRFAVLGDSGGGGLRQREVARVIEHAAPDLVLHTGDSVYSGFVRELADQRHFSVYRRLMSHTPFFHTAGNHDIVYGDEAFYEANVFPTNSVTGTEHFYSFDHGEAHFVVLFETWFIQNQLRIGDLQYQWLTNDLAATRKPWKFLILHHPILTSGLHRFDDYGGIAPGIPNGIPDRIDLLNVLLPVAARYGVQFMFSGHDHNYERFNPVHGLTQIVTGGGGGSLYYLAQLDSASSQFWLAYHTVVVDLDAHELRLRALDHTGLEFDRFSVRPFAPATPPFHAHWHTPLIESASTNDSDGNIFGQTFDFAGGDIPAVAGRFANLGRVVVNNDRTHLYLGLRGLMLHPDSVVLLFLDPNPGIPAAGSSLAGLGNGVFDPAGEGVEILDWSEGVAFVGFQPRIACVLGDEFADGSNRAFLRAGVLPTGQGVFRLEPGFPELAAVRLQQFNRSPQLGAVPGEQNADFVEVAIPWQSLGGAPTNGAVRIAAIVAAMALPPSTNMPPAVAYDHGYLGASWTRAADGRSGVLAPLEFQLAQDPDPDDDGLPTELEREIGTNPLAFDTDGDGLPDGWEHTHGLNPLSASGDDGASGDPDRDSHTNLDEFIAGTHPRQPVSHLRLDWIRLETGRIRLQWHAVPGRRYSVDRSSAPGSPFQPIVDPRLPIVATDSTAGFDESLDQAAPTESRYYRIRVLP